jgi:hypothetical protein
MAGQSRSLVKVLVKPEEFRATALEFHAAQLIRTKKIDSAASAMAAGGQGGRRQSLLVATTAAAAGVGWRNLPWHGSSDRRSLDIDLGR